MSLSEFADTIDTLFFGARNTTFSVPEKYRLKIMRAMYHFAMEQLNGGSEEETEIIRDAYLKWAGEPYNDSDEEE
jgi:hypothetical protein